MRKTTLALTLGFLPIAFFSQPVLKSDACDAIAVIQMSRDSTFKQGQRLCKGQSVNNPSAPVFIRCFHTGKTFWLKSAEDLNQCVVPLNSKSSVKGNEQFFRARGSDERNEPKLIKPVGGYTNSLQPTLVWRAVPGAEHYSIIIWGENRQTIQTTQTYLAAGTGMPLLTLGRTYTIIVKAISEKGLLSKSVSTLTVLGQ
jgi:hypothetical protein